jgi:hypothetical protein
MEGCAYEQTIQRRLLEDLQCTSRTTDNRGNAEPTKDKTNSLRCVGYIYRPGKKDITVFPHTHSHIKSFSSFSSVDKSQPS